MKISNRFFKSTTRKVEQVAARARVRNTYPDGIEATLSQDGPYPYPELKLEMSAAEATDFALDILVNVANRRREIEREKAKAEGRQ